ncbi:carboxypeptidase-like regulatory domain-containing protein [Pedosphaera parvula]|uniref:Uncharacterized protein n=1 Tax=Pedosphaera parvula (strain Ellin514) TaxID=320771 RepID=B9XHX2_PEDPL|nr:carboxypeptidase-like regulatory domain-containing protein [Pedosphaera parvula]EEF60465.1 hypothetical protein Cflav_PD3435 [Pedosphaera parvula Ellin514]
MRNIKEILFAVAIGLLAVSTSPAEEKIHGVVLDDAGRPVAGARVLDATSQVVFLMDGKFGCGAFKGTTTNTDDVGRFLLRGVGENKTRVIVVSEDGQMIQPVEASGPGQALKITLPKPATLLIRYDIPGDVAEAYFELTLRTNKLKLPLWNYITLKTTAKVSNGGQIVLSNLTAGTYDFSRIRIGGPTNSGFMFMSGDPAEFVRSDLQRLDLKSGRTQQVHVVRSLGQRVQGQVTGLEPTTNLAGAYLYLGSATAIGSPLDFKSKLEPCFDAVELGEDGHFQTALLEPGTYTLVAEVFNLGEPPPRKPVADDEPEFWGFEGLSRSLRLAFVGSTKVTVTRQSPPSVVKFRLRPWVEPQK